MREVHQWLISCGVLLAVMVLQGRSDDPTTKTPIEPSKLKIGQRVSELWGWSNGLDPIGLDECDRLGKTVVLVEFWSLKDSERLVAHKRLVEVRKEFLTEERFMMISICVEGGFEEWMKHCEKQQDLHSPKFGSVPFYFDAYWWQCYSDADVAPTLPKPLSVSYGLKETPSYFLVQNGGKLLDLQIKSDDLSSVITNHLMQSKAK